MPSDGKSLLDLGFTVGARRDCAALSTDGELETQESATLDTSTMGQPRERVASHSAQRPTRPTVTTIPPTAIAEVRIPQEQAILSLVSKTFDAVIQSNVNA